AITHARLRWLTAGFLAGGTALMAASLAGTAWWAKLPFLDRLVSLFPVRFKGLPGAEEGFNPNAVGGSLILFLPLVLTLAAHFMRPQNREHRGQKLALAGILFLLFAMGGTLLLSQSRGAWLGFCSGVALLLFVRYRWFRWTSIITAVTGLTTALIYKPWLGWAQPQGNGFVAGTEMSFAARLEIWTRAIYGVQDFPFTGMGMNAFRKVVNVLYPLFTISPETDISNSHNQLLQTALDLGIPGLVAYVAIWAATFWMLWRIWRKTQDTFHRALASGLAAGLIAQFVFGINDATALGAKVGVFWWIALALAASLDRLERNGSREAAQSTRTTGRAWELPLLWILVSLVSISFVGDHPYLALGFAILGGSYLGFEAVRTFQPG
ncbi:MAG TPA: O-antigen ligase family protein, partial [Acidobacteriota bacterium]|nr:O-antigen ligase family protein [Acidobacteriota bacterium]